MSGMYGTKKRENILRMLVKNSKAHGRYELAKKYEDELKHHMMKKNKKRYIKPSNMFA